MISYVIGVLPLIHELQDAHPRVTQPCYADDVGAVGSFGNIIAHFKDIQVRRPPRGYFQETTKRILVVSPWNVDRAEELFWGMRLMMFTGRHYLGGLIGDQDAETTWLN